MAFAYVATVPSAMVFSGFFFLDFFFQNRPHPKKKNFFFFGENFCDVEKKNFFWARQRDKWHFVARLESLVALVALLVDPTKIDQKSVFFSGCRSFAQLKKLFLWKDRTLFGGCIGSAKR